MVPDARLDGPAIETTDLTKRFGDVLAVDGLDLSIPQGDVYGFLGPNGSGKTTTMRMLTTLTRPTSGSARVMGIDVTDRRELISVVGYLPEEPPLFDELTAREQLRHVAALHDLPREGSRERIEAYLDRFSLASEADRRLEGFSTGMRKKVGLIATVLHEPPVIFLDEPTSGLDPRAARTVKDLIAELAGGDTTVFLSTHILPVVDELADTVGVLHRGDLVAEGPPDELKQRAEEEAAGSLEDVFLEVTTDHAAEAAEAPTAEGAAGSTEAALNEPGESTSTETNTPHTEDTDR